MNDIIIKSFASTLQNKSEVEEKYTNNIRIYKIKPSTINGLIQELQDGVINPEESFRRIGKGNFSIYDLNNGMVLKVNETKLNYAAGKKLTDLQGLPFVPKIHYYSEEGKYIVMEKVNGIPIAYYEKASWFAVRGFDLKKHDEMIEEFISGCISKGWFPSGFWKTDCMIVEDGTFWFTDVDYFVEYQGQDPAKLIKTLQSYGKIIVDSSPWNLALLEHCGREYLYKLNYIRTL